VCVNTGGRTAGLPGAQRAAADVAPLAALVESTIDLKALENHEFLIKADFDARLQGAVKASCTPLDRPLTRAPASHYSEC
jgi:hypothetical protein